MAQKDGAITTVQRADIGPETARYLMAQFEGGATSGEATVMVRRVV